MIVTGKNAAKYAGLQMFSFWRNLLLMTAVILLIRMGEKEVFSLMDSLIKPCTSGTYITIDSLHAYCKIPGDCGKKFACEDQSALIQGYIDYGNVFDRSTYPMLPYQKFWIINANHTKTIEVWVTSEGSEAVFRAIAEKKTVNPDGPVFVKGILSGFDMPIMGKCHRGLKLVLTGVKSISYPGDGFLPKKQ